jgi:hypothetical protein
MTTKLSGLLCAAVLATSSGGGSTEPPDDVLFEDAFDDDRNGWGIIDHPEFGSTSFADGDYVWTLKGSSGHLLPAVLGEQYDHGELEMLDVTVRAGATIDAGDGVIGLFCREGPDTDAEWQWYEFVARDGFAAIRRADSEGNLDVLAETNDVRLPNGEPMTIQATCVDDNDGNASLTLSLMGVSSRFGPTRAHLFWPRRLAKIRGAVWPVERRSGGRLVSGCGRFSARGAVGGCG